MKTYQTPTGRAGSDQVNAMEESVNAHLEQMFDQIAKRNVLDYGVGRTTANSPGADTTLRLDAQRRECDASIVFHAGRALELALHIVYARGADQILGKIDKDRVSHNLADVYDRIVKDLNGRNMVDAFEDVYQRALHTGVVALLVDEELVSSFHLGDDIPFREIRMDRIVDGAEMTLDHSPNLLEALMGPTKQTSGFMGMSHKTFEDFLQKSDSVYYVVGRKRRNMRWAHYSARDHEYGRPYVVIGTKFFARLVGGIVGLSNQRWTWDEAFARRLLERRQYNIRKLMEAHAMQNFREEIDFPEMISIDESLKQFTAMSGPPKRPSKDDYDFLHRKWEISTEPRTGSA